MSRPPLALMAFALDLLSQIQRHGRRGVCPVRSPPLPGPVLSHATARSHKLPSSCQLGLHICAPQYAGNSSDVGTVRAPRHPSKRRRSATRFSSEANAV